MTITTNIKNVFIENNKLQLDNLNKQNHIVNSIPIYYSQKLINGYCDLKYLKVIDYNKLEIPQDDNYKYVIYKLFNTFTSFDYIIIKEPININNENINQDYYFDINDLYDETCINQLILKKKKVVNEINEIKFLDINILELNKKDNEYFSLLTYIPKPNLVIPVLFNTNKYNPTYNGKDKIYNEYDYNKYVYEKRIDDIKSLDLRIRKNKTHKNHNKLHQLYIMPHYQQIKEAIEEGNFTKSQSKLINLYILCGEKFILEYLFLNTLSLKFTSHKYKYEEKVSEELRRLINKRTIQECDCELGIVYKITTTYNDDRKKQILYSFNKKDLIMFGGKITQKQLNQYKKDKDTRQECKINNKLLEQQPTIIDCIDYYN